MISGIYHWKKLRIKYLLLSLIKSQLKYDY